ncbi:MAG: ribosome biogenesis GTP-binding protein YihA/YsxC [Lautropia sp.]
MGLLATARFCDTVVKDRQLRALNPLGLPEIAFVGRSNAGKSSCINLICGRRRLAFASRTPGRTQALNVFAVGPADGPLGFLVDSPGYGFAAASQSAKLAWQALAGDYIRNRGPLAAVVLMIDIRRELTALDRQLVQWVPATTPLIVVLTKSDKLGRQQMVQARRHVEADPLLVQRTGASVVILFSTIARRGIDALQDAIEAVIRGGSPLPSCPPPSLAPSCLPPSDVAAGVASARPPSPHATRSP